MAIVLNGRKTFRLNSPIDVEAACNQELWNVTFIHTCLIMLLHLQCYLTVIALLCKNLLLQISSPFSISYF